MSTLIKQTIRFDFDDLQWLKVRYRKLGYNQIIRLLVKRHRRAVEARFGREITDADLAELGDSVDPDSIGVVQARPGEVD